MVEIKETAAKLEIGYQRSQETEFDYSSVMIQQVQVVGVVAPVYTIEFYFST